MQEIGWTYTIKPLGINKEFYLVEVIAMILKYLKYHLITVDLDKNMEGVIKASDFDWVITVPAMWKARGRHMMREAAYMVSNCEATLELAQCNCLGTSVPAQLISPVVLVDCVHNFICFCLK